MVRELLDDDLLMYVQTRNPVSVHCGRRHGLKEPWPARGIAYQSSRLKAYLFSKTLIQSMESQVFILLKTHRKLWIAVLVPFAVDLGVLALLPLHHVE